jgi:hypothetical protein
MTIDHRKLVTLTNYNSPYVEYITSKDGYQVTDTVTRYTKPVFLIDNLFGDATLDLNFASTKSIGDLVTFSRASTGTYVGSDGLIKTAVADAPRFDHDPVTGESLGLLIEESRTNLITNSRNLADYFTEQNSTATANSGVSPDGTTAATVITPDITNSIHSSYNTSINLTASTAYSYSIFVKPNGYTFLQLLFSSSFSNPNAWVNFNLTGTGSFGFTGGGELDKEIQAYPNGWYKCTVIATSGSSASTGGPVYITLDADRNSRNPSYAGNGTSGAYLWGVQLEAGSFPTSYIPTTDSVVTRAPDIASIEGTNFSSWYNQSEGTTFVEVLNMPQSSGDVFETSNGTVTNRRTIRFDSNADKVKLTIQGQGNQSQQQSAGSYSTSFVSFKAAATDNFKFFVDGVSGDSSSNTSALPTNMTQMSIGYRASQSSYYLNGHITRLAYFTTRKTDQELINLTK